MNENQLILFRIVSCELGLSLDRAKAQIAYLRDSFDYDDRIQERVNYLCGLLDSAVEETKTLRVDINKRHSDVKGG
jgi:hypothetical protein